MMGVWSDLRFVNPELLLLVPGVIAIFFWWRRQSAQRGPTLRVSSMEGIEAGWISWRVRLRLALPYFRLLALVLLSVAMARPQRMLKEERIRADGIDIMMVMDLSSSMLAQDFQPNRLEVSKRVAIEFVGRRPYDRIGLAVFSGEAFTQCPLTTDHAVVKQFLASLQCGFLEDGTAIGMGLATGVNRIKDSEVKSKVIILLTDGVNNAGYIKPATAAEIAGQYGIKVYTIGVGSMGDALTPVSRRGDGQYIFGLARVEIDETLMQQIAEMTGGKYFRATSAQSLEKIYAEIDALEKTKIEVKAVKRYSEAYRFWLLAGLLMLVLEFAFRHSIVKSITD
jgi:Ca-activated chloride channel family protein